MKRRSSALALIAASLAAVNVASPSTSYAASTSTPRGVAEQPVCAAAASGHARCLSIRLRPTTTTNRAAQQRAVPLDAHGPAGGFSPADLAKAYGLNPDQTTGSTVAVVAAFSNPHLKADLNVFDRQYGIKAETVKSFAVYNQSGSATPLPPARADWATEQSLDVQAVRGICHTCRIVVVQANSDADADLATAENRAASLGAKVITNSFGEPEPSTPVAPAVVAAFNHPGVAIIAGAGDNGMDSWDLYNTGGNSASAPMYPASLSTVIAVGGTTLQTAQSGARSSETVWNDDGPADQTGSALGQFGLELGATGGGCSTKFTAPRWQQAVKGWASTRCGTHRLSADISAVGDPLTGYDVYDSYGQAGGWATIGGTSLSTPIIAGMWGLAGGPSGATYPAQDLYGRAASAYFDVTQGGNGFCGGLTAADCTDQAGGAPNTFGAGYMDCAYTAGTATPVTQTGACDARVGFDGPSGLGTPRGLAPFSGQ